MDERIKVLACETELRRLGQFVDRHSQELWDARRNPPGGHVHVGPYVAALSEPREEQSLAIAVSGQHPLLPKVALVLGSLCSEMRFLAEDAKERFFGIFCFYREADADTGALRSFSRVLPVLLEAVHFQNHCMDVVLNVMQQLSILHSAGDSSSSLLSISDSHFQVYNTLRYMDVAFSRRDKKQNLRRLRRHQVVFEHLSRMLTALVTLDSILMSNQQLHSDLWTYKGAAHTGAYGNTDLKVKLEKDDLKELVDTLESVEERLFRVGGFKTCLKQNLDRGGVSVLASKTLSEELQTALCSCINDSESTLTDSFDRNHMLKIVDASALAVFSAYVFAMPGKRLMSRLWDLFKKVPCVHLYGNVCWFPEQFISAYLPNYAEKMDRKLLTAIKSSRQVYLQNKAHTFPHDVKAYQAQVLSWVARAETLLKRPAGSLNLEELHRKAELFLQALRLAVAIRNTATTVIDLHTKLSVQVTTSTAIAICQLLELLKVVEITFERHSLRILDLISHITQHIAFAIITVIEKSRRSIALDSRITQSQSDTISALNLASFVVNGPPTADRRDVVKICLALAAQNRTFKDGEMRTLCNHLNRLSVLANIQRNVADTCDTSFAYWLRVDIVPVYFRHVFDGKGDKQRLAYIFRALDDCARPVSLVSRRLNGTDNDGFVKESCCHFEADIRRYFQEEFLDPLCETLETDLRLQVHSHLKLDERNPFRSEFKDLLQYMNLQPFLFMGKLVDIKSYVESYLERTFYNLTTVALHNWRTYGEMRALAKQKFGADTVEDHLPAHTLEQGPDVPEITRHLELFVSRYCYNLNSQIFLERSSNSKYLSTIGIEHVANSIRTHGMGIMNTTVNFAYQLLRRKISVLSRLLRDEWIKSRLLKEIRFFTENSQSLEQKFPFDRAVQLTKALKKQGNALDEEGSCLDRFRCIITQIGNILGYVRMIRSGGLHFVSKALQFVPDQRSPSTSLAELMMSSGDSTSETLAAATSVDEAVSTLRKSFFEGTEYFQLLVSVFSKQFLSNSDKHFHLGNFYALLPALTVSHVETLVAAKERITKKKGRLEEENVFMDDGFAMGVAYVLSLLGQWSLFDAFHWFHSVREKYSSERESVKRQAGAEEKLQQTLALTTKRLGTYQREFDLLFYNLSSARIFFREPLAGEDRSQLSLSEVSSEDSKSVKSDKS